MVSIKSREGYTMKQWKKLLTLSASVLAIAGSAIGVNAEALEPVEKSVVDISHILGNLITVIFDYQILRKPLKILSL